MKGFLTLCSAVLALLKVVCIPAEAQDAEMTDTLARAVISSSRPAIASTGLKRFDGGELLGGAAILGSPDVVKFLQNLPGVASGMELMSGLYVRGGDGTYGRFAHLVVEHDGVACMRYAEECFRSVRIFFPIYGLNGYESYSFRVQQGGYGFHRYVFQADFLYI